MNQLPGLDLGRLQAYLTRMMDEPPTGELTGHLMNGGRSNLTYAVTDGSREWVVRRPPRGFVQRSAHDVGREYRVMSALASGPVPVPSVVLICSDPSVIGAPFYVMNRVDGVVIRSTAAFAATDEQSRTRIANDLIDVMADLHMVEAAQVGLEDLGRPDGYLERQVSRWARQYREIAVRDLPEVGSITAQLLASLPRSPGPAIVHGDYRLDNVLVNPGSPGRPISAVLDWEMATLGDPLTDLGNLISCWDEAGSPYHPITEGLMTLSGVPSRREAMERYASRTGLDLTQVDWYVTFNLLKLAVVLEQIYARDVRGETIGDAANGVGELALRVLERAAAGQS